MDVERLSLKIKNDPKRVILQLFDPRNADRIKRIIKCIENMPEAAVVSKLEEVLKEFEHRHKNYKRILLGNYKKIKSYINTQDDYSEERKILTGAYFSKEYSVEASALFNPSIVPHPDQTGLKEGELRYILSLRATGEGHVSSIEFRSGILTNKNEILPDPVSKYSMLPDEYIENAELNDAYSRGYSVIKKENFDIKFNSESTISERVIFPYSETETIAMEDARFVKFKDEYGIDKYYGTYTAYNGKTFHTQLIETTDFIEYKIRTLSGTGVKDKGMALFPEKINGKYAMISREDSESIFVLFSDSVYSWEKAEKIIMPENNWEFIQLGNCGSPIKTREGWLLITHAVGPMRKYVKSACLLDLNNPSKVLGRMSEPLISPTEEEREGYVPNVVYSCGSLIHNNELIIPYAMSDAYCGFAKVNVSDLIDAIIKK